MQHPNKEQRENQRKLLAQLPEEEREEHARLLRFGNAAYIYHQQAKEFELNCAKIAAIIYSTTDDSVVEIKNNNLSLFNIDSLF